MKYYFFSYHWQYITGSCGKGMAFCSFPKYFDFIQAKQSILEKNPPHTKCIILFFQRITKSEFDSGYRSNDL